MALSEFKFDIHEIEETTSTNTHIKGLAKKGAPDGTVVVAKSQTAGKGSGDRIWASPPGGLYLSILLSPKGGRDVTDMPLIAGIAVAQTVKNFLPKSKDVSLKWPNDCLVGWKKVAGVLSEGLGESYGNQAIVGIGINVNVDADKLAPFQDRPFGATSFKIEAEGEEFDLVALRDMLLKKLASLYEVYHASGFQPMQYLWEKNCGFVGKRVELKESATRKSLGNEFSGKSLIGTFLGIDDTGGLVLSNPKGERRSYYSGEITCFWP